MAENQECYMNIENMILAALTAADYARDANYIRYTVKPDRLGVVLQTHVNGEDGQWITYDRSQLDELIRALQNVRDELFPSG